MIFNYKNGRFKLIQFTDIHYVTDTYNVKTGDGKIMPVNEAALYTIEKMVKEENPDLIIFTGDLVFASGHGMIDNLKMFENIGKLLDSLGVPWVFTNGNHDGNNVECLYSWEKLFDTFSNYKTYAGDKNDIFAGPNISQRGYGNGVVRLKDKNNVTQFAFILIDNGWGYSEKQASWLENAVNMLKEENPNVKAIAFAHCPFDNYGDKNDGTRGKNQEEGMANYSERIIEGSGNFSDIMFMFLNDGGVADIIEKSEIITSAFVGHFHKNDCIAILEKNGRKLYQGFGKTGDYIAYNIGEGAKTGDPMERGCRIFLFEEGKSTFTTYIKEVNGKEKGYVEI